MRPAIALLAALFSLSAAAASDSVFLEELTSAEVAARVAAGTTTIVIPVGGTEQHGARIALGKHNARVRSFAGEIARRAEHTLVAPVVSYVPEGSIDPPTGHMKGAGTISIPERAFEDTLYAAARSFMQHGFRTVVLLGDHGGYQASLARVQRKLNGRVGRLVVIVPGEYYREVEHAGTADVELTLTVDPSLVREAGKASLERGRAARELIVAGTVRAVRQAQGR